MNKNVKDITGQRFGRLVVISFNRTDKIEKKAYWNVRCDCGNFDIARGDRLRSGRKKSCGCFQIERGGQNLVNSRKMIEDLRTRDLRIEDYKEAIYALLNIAFNEKQSSLVEIAINVLHGKKMNEKYKQDSIEGFELFKFTDEKD